MPRSGGTAKNRFTRRRIFCIPCKDSGNFGRNILTVYADNSPNDTVYPQVADFTFYGGIYRDVTVIGVDESHFDLEFYGSSGIMITPKVSGSSAAVNITARVTNPQDCSVRFVVTDADKKPVGEKSVDASDGKTVIEIENAHLWNGTQDPYLYSLTAELLKDGEKQTKFR